MMGRSFFARGTRGRGWVVPFLVLSTVGFVETVTISSKAQEDPRKGQSTPIFEEGLKLADRGKNAEALAKFRESYGVYPSPNTLFNIGRTEHLLGRNVEALRDYREAVKNPILNPQMVERGKKYIAELEKVVGRVEVTGPGGQQVSVNGATYTLPLSGPVDVEAGHVVVKGEGGEKTADVGAGEFVKVDVSPETSEAPASASSETQGASSPLVEPPREKEEESFWGWRSVTGLSLLGVGAVAVGAGFLFSADESSEQDRLDGLNRSIGGSSSACAGVASDACSQLADAKQSRDAAGDRATAAFVGGGVAMGLGAAFVVSALVVPHRKSATSGRLMPAVSPRYAGLVFRTEF